MRFKTSGHILALALALLLAPACSDDDDDDCGPAANDDDDISGNECGDIEGRCIVLTPGENDQEAVQQAMLEVQPGDMIFFKAGNYQFEDELTLSVPNVTLKGEGMDESVLSWKGQRFGAQAIYVDSDHFTVEDLGMEDMLGDGLKIFGADVVTIRNVRIEHTAGPDPDNGPYGFYPVQCTNVLIEDNLLIGASDGGIYVGQSEHVVVRRNRCERNVMGISIENVRNGEIYDNELVNNAGGLMVMDLPDLQWTGGHMSVHDNFIGNNNTENFGNPSAIVGFMPTGLGMLVMANDDVEVFNNHFHKNETANLAVVSYSVAEIFGSFTTDDPLYDRYPETIHIHDNLFEGGGNTPHGTIGGILKDSIGTPLPDIIFDGDLDPAKTVDGKLPAELNICIHDNGDASFANIDVPGNFVGKDTDLTPYDCEHEPNPKTVIPQTENE